MIQFAVRVVPRSSKPGIAGTRDGALLVRLQSPPIDNAANEELIRLLAGAFRIPRRGVSIVAGNQSRLKRVAIAEIDHDRLHETLQSIGIDPALIRS